MAFYNLVSVIGPLPLPFLSPHLKLPHYLPSLFFISPMFYHLPFFNISIFHLPLMVHF